MAQKHRKDERHDHEALEQLADKGHARKFYEKKRRLTEGLKTGVHSFRAQRDVQVTDAQRLLNLWRENFSSLLIGSKMKMKHRARKSNNDDGKDVKLPNHEEVRIAIGRLKNNKAALQYMVA